MAKVNSYEENITGQKYREIIVVVVVIIVIMKHLYCS